MRQSSVSVRGKRAGFTLVELALICGAAGVVLGGIWTASSSLSKSRRVYQSTQQVMETVQNMREYYMNASGISLAACGAEITTLLDPKIFPTELRRCSGGVCTLQAAAAGASATSTFRVKMSPSLCVAGEASAFRIALSNIAQDACTRLVLAGVEYRDSSLGVSSLCVGANCFAAGAWQSVTCSTGVCTTTPSLTTPAQAAAACAPANREIAWEFKLRN